jgi:carboxymethylenebutenolidase
MCHPELSAGQSTPEVSQEEVPIPVAPGETMPALLARPEAEQAPAVLVVADMFGRSPFYEDLASRLAAAGFEALVPEFFFRQGPLPERSHEAAVARRRNLDERRSLDDLSAAIGWLRRRPGYSGRIGTVGFCMGGTFVLDLAASEDDLVTVAYYGFPVPQASLVSPPPAPLDLVGRMRGPILALWGDEDATVGLDNVERFVRRMEEHGKDFSHRIYPGVGHGFLASGLGDGPPPAGPAGESWALALDHLRRHLGAETAPRQGLLAPSDTRTPEEE